jgi:hypothetical protein
MVREKLLKGRWERVPESKELYGKLWRLPRPALCTTNTPRTVRHSFSPPVLSVVLLSFALLVSSLG